MCYNDLENYYKVIFNFVQFHKWSLTELENLTPYERDYFIILMNNHLEEEELKAKSITSQ